MRSLLVALGVSLLHVSCGGDAVPEMRGSIDLALAKQYFGEMKALCSTDDGQLWGVSLCGPLLFVDPETRTVVASQANTGGVLESRRGVFVGELPAGIGIANTATEWGETRWTMLIWSSLGDDPVQRSTLLAHEAFHRVQPELGLDTSGEINAHLDTADGRFWMQLEWTALQKALSTEGDVRREAVADALTFRAVRRTRFPAASECEIPLEIFEGLAEYTGMRLAGYTPEQVIEGVIARRRDETGFVRSFAYVSGPLYGFMLDQSGTPWRQDMRPGVDLGALLGESMAVVPWPEEQALGRATPYGAAALRRFENDRAEEREARRSGDRTPTRR